MSMILTTRRPKRKNKSQSSTENAGPVLLVCVVVFFVGILFVGFCNVLFLFFGVLVFSFLGVVIQNAFHCKPKENQKNTYQKQQKTKYKKHKNTKQIQKKNYQHNKKKQNRSSILLAALFFRSRSSGGSTDTFKGLKLDTTEKAGGSDVLKGMVCHGGAGG